MGVTQVVPHSARGRAYLLTDHLAAASVSLPKRTGTLGVGMRFTAWLLGAVAAVTVIAACGSSGTYPQSFTPSPPQSLSESTSPSTPTVGPSTPAPHTDAPALPTPTVTPPAQPAVDAYFAFVNATLAADRDPQHADLAKIDKYLTGKALQMFDGVYAKMKRQGLAYRGTPAVPRVRVQTILSPTAIFLESCPQANASDPYTEYHLASGKPIVFATPSPPPPYLLTLPMKQIGGQWKLYDVLQNASKTCTG